MSAAQASSFPKFNRVTNTAASGDLALKCGEKQRFPRPEHLFLILSLSFPTMLLSKK